MTSHKIFRAKPRFARQAEIGKGIGINEAVAAAEARLDAMGDEARNAIGQMLADFQNQREKIAQHDRDAFVLVHGQADTLAGLAQTFSMPEVARAAISLCQLFEMASPRFPATDGVLVHLDAFRMFRAMGPEAVTAAAPVVLEGLKQVVIAESRNAPLT